MEFSAWVTARGFDPNTLTEAQKISLTAMWRAEQNQSTPAAAGSATATATAPTVAVTATPGTAAETSAGKSIADASMEQIFAQQRAENQRKEFITELVAKYLAENPDRIEDIERVGKLAIEGKWDREKAELNLLRFCRGAGPTVHVPSAPEVNNRTLEAALCRAGGLKTLEKDFDARTLDDVDRKFKGGIGLQETLLLCARQNGFRDHSVRDLRGALQAAFNDPGPARGGNQFGSMGAVIGVSTLDISGILSNTANKFLREGFMAVETAWREISATRSVRDFKAITSYSLTGDLQYEKVAPGGEIKHGTLGEETYTNQVDTYGKLIGIDRRDWINDDLGALTSVGRRLGRGGALKLNDVFWTEFLDNSTFFTAARGNYDDGTDTAFGSDGLAAAHAIWRAQTDPDGKPLSIRARILLVPPGHEVAAMRLMTSQQLLTADDSGNANIWNGRFQVVVSDYLANSAYTGNSALAWYLIADPADMPVIEVAFLNGQEMPTIETADFEFDRLGTALRGFHDFGAALQEYRGGLKLKGEA